MQGCPPEPCRRRHCPAQAGWPHRRARREALRNAVGGNGATRRGLTPEKRTSTDPDKPRRSVANLVFDDPSGAAEFALRIKIADRSHKRIGRIALTSLQACGRRLVFGL